MSSDASQPASAPHPRILDLDALPAAAAINLVRFHFTHVYSVKYGYSSPLGFVWPYGAYGVEIFFILSGYINSMSPMRHVFGCECLAPVIWTLQIEMTFYATLVGQLQLSGLKRCFLGWGSLLAMSLCICPTLDAMQSTHGEAA